MDRSSEVRALRPAWPTWQNPVSTKNTNKISWAWWRVHVVPATWEAEAGESLEPGRRREPGRRSQIPSQKKKKRMKYIICTRGTV